jgi:hypothetical protein
MIVGYPQPNKSKSLDVVGAFVQGAGGRLSRQTDKLEEGDACFYGVVGIEHLLEQARAEGRGYWYGDNSFFDRTRGTHFRFARNGFQFPREAKPDWDRWRSLNVEIRAWRETGRHIVVAEQSEHFLRISGAPTDWTERTVATLRKYTDREIRIRSWMRNKGKAAESLHEDLREAWALVTHTSAAAIEALIDGVPVFVSSISAARPMASGGLSKIEHPKLLEGREEFCAGLAGLQWTITELRSGVAWRTLITDAGLATA